MIKTRKAGDVKQKFARVVIMGEAGTGKTTLCKTLPDLSKVLFINTAGYEDGDIVLSDTKGITILDVETIGDFPELVKELKSEKYKDKEVVFFDSLTGLSSMSIKFWETQYPDRKQNAVWDMYREHGEALRDAFLQLKSVDKHVFFTALMKQSNDKVAKGILVPKVDGGMFEESIRAWADGTIALKSYEDGSRKILLQNNGDYACKLRVPSGEKIPMLLDKPEQISLTYILEMMGFKKEAKNG
jgi:hypothetical protein